MENLPLELIESIIIRVDCSLKDFLGLSLVCREWYLAVNDPLLINRFFASRFSQGLSIELNEILWNEDEKRINETSYC